MNQIFVARQDELGELDDHLLKMINGEGRVCFISGQAGSGKTALTSEFIRRAQAQYTDLVAAIGSSDTQISADEAYLPFREVLNQLTGDVETQLAQGKLTPENTNRLKRLVGFSGQTLAEVGPDLIGLFLPGAGFITRVGVFLAEKAGLLEKLEKITKKPSESDAPAGTQAGSGIQQIHIFSQYTNVLLTLATKQPVIIVLDDLQWADGASTELLFHLGRRIGQSRILIIGAYRPDEVAIGRSGERHPLEKVIDEFKRYFGDIFIELDEIEDTERQRFMNLFLDSEPNRLSARFRQALYQHTSGHALFTIELLRNMQERGDLILDQDRHWVEGPTLDWRALPARIEGVLEERINRLQEDLREALAIASLEGLDFTAEVVARVQAVDERGLVKQLSSVLDKQHRLVSARGTRRMGEQRLSTYRFEHYLFQQYLYNQLDEVERAYLHEEVGLVLEAIYGNRADEIAVQLAWHFVEAKMADKARHYLLKAGQQAAKVFANQEALKFFTQALDLTPETNAAERYALLLGRENVYHLIGNRTAQKDDLAELQAMVEALGEAEGDQAARQAEVSFRRAVVAEVTGDYPACIQAAQDVIHFAQIANDERIQSAGYRLLGDAHSQLREHDQAKTHLEKALSISCRIGDRKGEALALNSLGVVCQRFSDLPGARRYYDQALPIAREISDRLSEGKLLNNLGNISGMSGELDEAGAYYEQSRQTFYQTGFRIGEGFTLGNLGVVYAQKGLLDRARGYMEDSLLIFQEIGDRNSVARTLNNLGENAVEQSDFSSAKTYFERALDLFRVIDKKSGESVALAHLGNLVFNLGDFENARLYFEQALDIARDNSDLNQESVILHDLGMVFASQRLYSAARSYYEHALQIQIEIGEKRGSSFSICNLGYVAAALGQLTQAQARYGQALEICAEIGNKQVEARCLTYRSLLAHQQGAHQDGLADGRQAVQLAEELGSKSAIASALLVSGHAYHALGDTAAAQADYERAIKLWVETGQAHLAVEGRAGLARTFLTLGDLGNAKVQVEAILESLENTPPDGTLEPFRIYHTCYQALSQLQDERAHEILQVAIELLTTSAAAIEDEDLRKSYLENVAVHQELLSVAD